MILFKTHHQNPCFLLFQKDVSAIALPERFTFPFNYEAHELCKIATAELQNYLVHQKDWQHDFGFGENPKGLGKMFGVLVVKDKAGELGYLVAFSGKLIEKNDLPYFVPPVFDLLNVDGFYKKGEEEINIINRKVDELLTDEKLIFLENSLKNKKLQAEKELSETKEQLKIEKINRQKQRAEAATLPDSVQQKLNAKLSKESALQSFFFKDLNKKWRAEIEETEAQLAKMQEPILFFKEKRKKMSNSLQRRLFGNYVFYNCAKKTKTIADIFDIEEDGFPPSGAGECAAPKLLQYAFLNDFQPVAMAEFWWGEAPPSEIRKHRHFYPACKSKCKPILTHMLEGTALDPDPTLTAKVVVKDLEVCYEDEELVVINKPAEFLSVPGTKLDDSVFHRMRKKYPDATGPMIVHRLDQSTSGLMIIAKTEQTYHFLQNQFLERKVRKRYVAVLEGEIAENSGVVALPIRVDLDNRPRQLVCYEHGKPSTTHWKVVERKDGKTHLHLYPITGRTHQLRVHCSHKLGLNVPILGDDLYGSRTNRLHLHAERITFMHPTKGKEMTVLKEADF